MAENLHEVSTIIGELRNFASMQAGTNDRLLEELKGIAIRMERFAEVSAAFVEYRQTLQERFNNINDRIEAIDCALMEHDSMLRKIEIAVSGWRQNWKMLTGGIYLAATASASVFSYYVPVIVHAILHAN